MLRCSLALLAASGLLALSNCKKDPDLPYKYEANNLHLPSQPYTYRQQTLPAHFSGLAGELQQRVTD